MASSSRKGVNRVLLLCSSINDRTAWPYWKFLQMKRIPGVTDMAILAFNSQGGSFEARIEGDRWTMKKYKEVKGYKEDMLERFVHKWHDPGRSYFVYGGHGMGDYMDLEQGHVSLQVHKLASIIGSRRTFEAMVFDACFMANLDCAYHLRHNTKYIGACEGYMWEPDHITSRHILNQRTAALMSRLRDPRQVLEQVQRSYCRHSPFADFSVIKTSAIEELRSFIQARVIPRVYQRAALYTDDQLLRLAHIERATLSRCESLYGWTPDGSLTTPNTWVGPSDALFSRKEGSAPYSTTLHLPSEHCFTAAQQEVMRRVQLEHALYPSLVDDKHLVDIRSYLLDMAKEEEAEQWHLCAAAHTPYISGSGSFPRTMNVNLHGTLPPSLASPYRSLSGSPLILHGSARHGLGLLDRVVVSHRGPRAKPIYAARLGGLSLAVHEFSAYSKPTTSWTVPQPQRAAWEAKVSRFQRMRCLPEVHLPVEPEVALVLKRRSQSLWKKRITAGGRSSKDAQAAVTAPAVSEGEVVGKLSAPVGSEGVVPSGSNSAAAVRPSTSALALSLSALSQSSIFVREKLKI